MLTCQQVLADRLFQLLNFSPAKIQTLELVVRECLENRSIKISPAMQDLALLVTDLKISIGKRHDRALEPGIRVADAVHEPAIHFVAAHL